MIVPTVRAKLIIAVFATALLSNTAFAQGGGGGFGITFGTHNPYTGPYYSPDEDVGGCLGGANGFWMIEGVAFCGRFGFVIKPPSSRSRNLVSTGAFP